MITLDNFNFADLLKNRLVFSEEDYAFFAGVDEMLKYLHSKTELVSRDHIPSEKLLDIIAVEENVDLYDSTLSYEQKKNLIDQSEYLKRRKGTKGALESALLAIYSDAEVYEWFEYGGEPYHFKIEIPMPETISAETNAFLLKVINTYKRATSILDGINFYTKVDGSIYGSCAGKTFERITIYPKGV